MLLISVQTEGVKLAREDMTTTFEETLKDTLNVLKDATMVTYNVMNAQLRVRLRVCHAMEVVS